MSQTTIARVSVRTIAASYTRPADTNAYAIGDVICNSTSAPTILTFARAGLGAGGSGIIQSAQLVDGAYPTTKLLADLFLFDTTVTMDNDNAAFTPTDAEMATCVGVITFDGTSSAIHGGDLTAGAGGNSVTTVNNVGLAYNTLITDNALYGVLVARNTYTPVSGGTFTVRLKVRD